MIGDWCYGHFERGPGPDRSRPTLTRTLFRDGQRRTSRGPMVTRGRRISLPFQAPRPILQEGFAPLGGSSTHSRIFPRCSHTPRGRHFTPETSSGGVQVATTLWRCHRSGCLTSLPGRECSAHTQNRGHDASMTCVYETNMPKRLRLEILSLG